MRRNRARRGRRKRHAKRPRKHHKPALPPSPPASPDEKSRGDLGTHLVETGSIFGGGPSRPGLWNLHLIHRAVRECWPVSPEMRERIPEHLDGCLTHAKTRAQMMAFRILVAMSRHNHRLRHAELGITLRDVRHRLAELKRSTDKLRSNAALPNDQEKHSNA
jgi:hypothetical protein